MIAEANAGEIGTGTIILNAPTGFEFNTAASVTILLAGNGTASRNINGLVNGSTVAVSSITTTAISFTVSSVSTRTNTLTWQGIEVRPTASTPLAAGNISKAGTSVITGVSAGANLGTLTEVTSTPACDPTTPSVTTNAATALLPSGATLNGAVSSNGASTDVTFEYGLTAAYGSTGSATPSPLAANAVNTAVSLAVTGLTCGGTTYHFRVNGTNSYGTTNGSDRTLTTAACPTLTEFNSSGGTTATNGLHFYLENTSKIQVKRLNNTGQVYSPSATPPSNNLDNGVFIRANGLVYGPSHTVTTFNPTGGMYNTYSITQASPANPSSPGVQQVATGTFGITSGPQVSVLWKYTTPLDFLTAEVTLTIPAGYAVSAANPVRYYHVFDTYLGGSDNGCGFTFVDPTTSQRIIGTYQPTSGTCASSTSIPSGVNVVESFRERSGQPFSSYCASGWASFFTNGSTNCSVLQSAAMSNAVGTTYVDTGIGVELDFTAPGTYTFSYDFVIGSPNVPPYDHLEIRHDGAGTLCPESITVLACTSSDVPCDETDRVNTGTLTGSLTITPGSPVVTKTPSGILLGIGAPAQAISLQTAGSGTVTLGTSGLSTTPLNGTKCWNTANSTQNCTLTFANTPCVSGFECLETSATYNNLVTTPTARNPLYTKLSGTDFKFDVLALQSSGALATSYTASSNVKVELFADSVSPAPACSAYTSPIASQSITFAAGDAGRKTLSTNFNLAKAYGKVRCRVSDANLSPTIYGCSSDDFAVRPQQFTLSSSNANADTLGASTTAAPTVRAGAAFSLTANTSTVGYAGTPSLNTANVSAHTGAVRTSTVAGTFGAADALTGNGATGASFTYGEVGYFRLNTDGVVDSTFTGIDSAVGDCVANSSSNSLSILPAIPNQYGCNVGNAVTPYFGRFIPDHFDTSVVQGCTPFTYSGQPFSVTVKAMNGAATPAITQNYDGSGAVFAKALTLTPVDAVGGALIPAMTGALNLTLVNAGAFRAGVGGSAVVGTVSVTDGSNVVTGSGTSFTTQLSVGGVVCIGTSCSTIAAIASGTSLTLASNYIGPTASGKTMQMWRTYTFANKQTGPTNVFVRATELPPPLPLVGDGVTSLRASSVEGGGAIRSGRVRLQNAYGSERLALPVILQLQYWNGSWQANTLDTCTSLSEDSFAFTFPAGTTAKPNNLEACETALTLTGSAPNYGLSLIAPGGTNAGWADISLYLATAGANPRCTAKGAAGASATSANAPWLQFNWKGAGVTDPSARATFGVYKSPLIYRRENY
ncbi:MAG: DUF6701 domain-containing protein [Pseudomonadota bacterium]